MATLTARGTREVARVTLERDVTDSDLITWQRTERALRSDGKTLEKRTVRFQPDQYDPKGRRHDYGWTLRGTLKAGATPQQWADSYRAKGWSAKLF